MASKIKVVIYEKEKALEDIRNDFQKEFLEIIKLLLIDEQILEYIEENINLINEYFNYFPNSKDNKLFNLIDKIKEDNNSSLFENYIEINLFAEKEYGLKRHVGKEEIEQMINKEVIDPIKKQIPNIALSYILLKYMGILYENLNKKLLNDYDESYKRIESKISVELKFILNKVYDNIIKNVYDNIIKNVGLKKKIIIIKFIL